MIRVRDLSDETKALYKSSKSNILLQMELIEVLIDGDFPPKEVTTFLKTYVKAHTVAIEYVQQYLNTLY